MPTNKSKYECACEILRYGCPKVWGSLRSPGPRPPPPSVLEYRMGTKPHGYLFTSGVCKDSFTTGHVTIQSKRGTRWINGFN